MKVFALTLVAALVIGASSAVKLRKAEQRSSFEETSAKVAEDEPITEISESDVDKKEKEVYKRGVFHYGSLAAHTGAWPKSYAAHYGYGLHLPAVSPFSVAPLTGGHVHAPGALRYNTGFHYRPLSSPAAVSSFSPGVLPTLTSFSSASVPHAHQAATAATPFVIRPGGAVVQSYSVNYPTASVKPVHTFASVAQPVHAYQPVQHVHPVQPVQHVQPVHPAVSVKPIHTFASVGQPVHPVQAVQPFHAYQHVHPVQPIQPVQPVQSVVQVQHVKPFVNYDFTTQQFPSYFQTFQPAPVPAVPAIPQVPTVPLAPAQPAFPEIPSFPNPPDFPNIPAPPSIPAVPNVPVIPQPQFPTNGFFPVNVQPPLPQQPPTFINFNPAGHIPGLVPVAGTPNQNNPDFGSAEASPQIPVQPAPFPEHKPEAELPPIQPQPTQQPWKPVFSQPPTVDVSDGNRPSNTLLPPYGNSPAEGYLPPAPASSSQKLQQEFAINSQLFDNLSDADIEQIFHQANLAAQRDHNHAHTVHTYRSHY